MTALELARGYLVAPDKLFAAIDEFARDEAFRTAIHTLRNATTNAVTLSHALLSLHAECERMRAIVERVDALAGAVGSWTLEADAYCDWLRATDPKRLNDDQRCERAIVVAFDAFEAAEDDALSAALDASAKEK